MDEIHRLATGKYVIAFTTHCGWWDRTIPRYEYDDYTAALRARETRQAAIDRTRAIQKRTPQSIIEEIRRRGVVQEERIAAKRTTNRHATYDAAYDKEYSEVLSLIMIAMANDERSEDENDMIRRVFGAYFPDA